MAKKQIIKSVNHFKSKDEKARSENYTKIWSEIINSMMSKKIKK